MKAALKALGYKIITSAAYLRDPAYCVRGAIYVKASSHTVCGLDNGSKAGQTLSAAGISGAAPGSGGTSRVKSLLANGATATIARNAWRPLAMIMPRCRNA